MMNKNPTFEELIERLKICSEINHPGRPWSPEGKIAITDAWHDKHAELKMRVEELESKIVNP